VLRARHGVAETAALLRREGLTARLTGVDLVDAFAAEPPPEVEFVVAPLADWRPAHRFDLITCVHGLHYVGDKLGALERAVSC
jgi:trans-aconitate methyltransferase